MRDILFKNLTSKDNKRHDVFISESHRENGKLVHSEKRFIYLIHGTKDFSSFEEINNFFAHPGQETLVNVKDVKIAKIHDSNSNLDKIFCKVVGNFYALCEKRLFFISFIHLFSIETIAETSFSPY